MSKNALYRKSSARQINSNTYHKKDSTDIRSILKREVTVELEPIKDTIDYCMSIITDNLNKG
jgi:hypothetical protein